LKDIKVILKRLVKSVPDNIFVEKNMGYVSVEYGG
jgi:hypothetical protein